MRRAVIVAGVGLAVALLAWLLVPPAARSTVPSAPTPSVERDAPLMAGTRATLERGVPATVEF